MPRPVEKTEQDFREHEIADAVRADINLLVAAYRRRMLNAIPDLIDDFRREVEAGVMPAIDEAYRERIRQAVHKKAKALR